MNPAAILATVVPVIAMLAYRWRLLASSGRADARTEWTYWILGGFAIAISVVLTVAGREAMLFATPVVLIPLGVYLVRRSATMRVAYGLDLQSAGWASVITGLLALVALVVGAAIRV